ncbi:hypothetical protein BX666DRAFT_1959224 [Dichotomocladium elegans]|nr:hypothetical protein BX666DRAFT_1959224 [Dichotomocladium elegans]
MSTSNYFPFQYTNSTGQGQHSASEPSRDSVRRSSIPWNPFTSLNSGNHTHALNEYSRHFLSDEDEGSTIAPMTPTEVSATPTLVSTMSSHYGSESVSRRSWEDSRDHEPYRCWICFGEETDSIGNWVKPCRCSLIAHERCLLNWITENQKKAPFKLVKCPQCNSSYHLAEKRNIPLSVLELADSLIRKSAPYLAFLGIGCSILVISTTYGAYTVSTLFGARESERLLGRPEHWGWRTWLSLPAIPAILILARSRWADRVLPFAAMLLLRATSSQKYPVVQLTWPPSATVVFGTLPWIRLIYSNIFRWAQRRLAKRLIVLERQHVRNISSLGGGMSTSHDDQYDGQEEDEARQVELLNNTTRGDLGLKIMGALLWPTISSVVGR